MAEFVDTLPDGSRWIPEAGGYVAPTGELVSTTPVWSGEATPATSPGADVQEFAAVLGPSGGGGGGGAAVARGDPREAAVMIGTIVGLKKQADARRAADPNADLSDLRGAADMLRNKLISSGYGEWAARLTAEGATAAQAAQVLTDFTNQVTARTPASGAQQTTATPAATVSSPSLWERFVTGAREERERQMAAMFGDPNAGKLPEPAGGGVMESIASGARGLAEAARETWAATVLGLRATFEQGGQGAASALRTVGGALVNNPITWLIVAVLFARVFRIRISR